MKPHELDQYIRDKLKEVPDPFTEERREYMNRTWQALDSWLIRRPVSFPWFRVAIIVLFLLIPAAFLYRKTLRQQRQILQLQENLLSLQSIHEQNPPDANTAIAQSAIFRHDTVRIVETRLESRKADTVIQIKHVTDTVVIYRQVELVAGQQEQEGNHSGYFHRETVNPNISQEGQRAEFLLKPGEQDHPRKQKSHRSFMFRFSLGGPPQGSSKQTGLQTRL